MEFLIVQTTVGTRQFANHLAQSVVAARLAACVQIQEIQGVFRWKGEIQSGPEYLLMIKTTAARAAELEQHIRANHSYETPEIVRIPISGGSPEYLAWLGDSVDSSAS